MECRKAEKPLPASLEALEVFRVEQKTAADEKKSNEMAGLLARLEASERRAMIAEAEANTLHIQLDQARTQAQAQAEQIGALKAEIASRPEAKSAPKLTRWQHLAAVFSG